MTQATNNCSIDDLVCVWLDQVIPLLHELDYLSWFGEKDIAIAEASRSHLFFAVKRVLKDPSSAESSERRILKFPISAIARVNQAISHLSRQEVVCEIQETNIVFLPTTIIHLAHQIPVAKSLFESGKSYAFLFPSLSWKENIDLGELNIINHSRYLRGEMLRARLRARVLWLRLGREKNVRLPKIKIDNKEHDLSGVVLTTIAAMLNSIFEGHAIAKYISKALNPKLIVLGNDLSAYGRTITACAKNDGIRVVSLLSQVADAPIDSYRTSDKIVVLGNYAKRTLSSWGVDNKKIKSCGSPFLDLPILPNELKFLNDKCSSPGKRKPFVFAQVDLEVEDRLRRVALSCPKHFFLVCLESNRKKDSTLSSLKYIKNIEVKQKQEFSNSTLAACVKFSDFVLTSRFDSMIEALSIGKKVVAIDFDGKFDNREILNSGVVEVATDESSLQAILEKKSENSEEKTQHAKNTYEDLLCRRDGQASVRIARVIIEECHR